ncbi:Gfo/Idh/MocA family oxidoreductase, partial [Parvibaculum sp.]|uniref:Gfo/Idh/MocA family oxidoreductase n=1 Tax=Parvibaculum sp. TaxID=2024848 RepID=UPI00342E89F1
MRLVVLTSIDFNDELQFKAGKVDDIRSDAMLAAESIDLLDIVTRMDTHRRLVETSVGKGIATIVQKPFAPNWED